MYMYFLNATEVTLSESGKGGGKYFLSSILKFPFVSNHPVLVNKKEVLLFFRRFLMLFLVAPDVKQVDKASPGIILRVATKRDIHLPPCFRLVPSIRYPRERERCFPHLFFLYFPLKSLTFYRAVCLKSKMRWLTFRVKFFVIRFSEILLFSKICRLCHFAR